ncbi:MAG: dTMP kinase [Verrucomicrobia bacterium]|nr:dTMP kinase [Verrucomicrobiota bacterium]
MLIVFEGIDGTGKSTQARRLGDWFAEQGREVVLGREPTNGPWGRRLRESAERGRLPPDEELECFLNDRREHVSGTIAPALAAGKVVILDRYYFSSMAYQGSRGFDPGEIRRLNEAFAPVPDLLILLDIDTDTALSRIGVRDGSANEFEQRPALESCRRIFLSLRDDPFVRVIDASGPVERVARQVLDAVGHPG